MPLSRNEVVAGALRLLDEVGLEALSMRRLAVSLGVQAGTIYWHFADKQDLYDAMVEAMMQGLLAPPLTGAWDDQLAEVARRVASALVRRRDGARLATLALRPGEHGLAVSEAMLRIAREAGFSKEAAVWATSVLGYYILGYVTDIQATQAAKARGLDAALRAFKKQLDAKRYPHLLALSEVGIAQMMSVRQFRARFEFGLKVILSGLERTPRRARVKKRRSPRTAPRTLRRPRVFKATVKRKPPP